MLAPNVRVWRVQIYASARFVSTFLRDGEAGAPETVGGLWRELLDGANLDVMLEGG